MTTRVPLPALLPATTLPRETMQMANALNALRQQRLQENILSARAQVAPQMQQAQLNKLLQDIAISKERQKYIPTQFQQAAKRLSLEEERGKRLAQQRGGIFQIAKLLRVMTPAQKNVFFAQYPQYKYLAGAGLEKALREMGVAQPPGAPGEQPIDLGAPPGDQVEGVPPPGEQPVAAPGIQPEIITPSGAPPITPPVITPRGAPPTGEVPEPVDHFKLASQIAANKGAVSAKINTRFDNTVAAHKLLKDPVYDRVLRNAAFYSGLRGRWDAIKDSLKKRSPDRYRDYLEFKNIFSPTTKNLIKNIEGLGATDAQRRELTGMIEAITRDLTSNPARALDQFKRLKRQLSVIAQGVSQAAQPVYPGARERAAGISFEVEPQPAIAPPSPQYTLEEALAEQQRRQLARRRGT